MNHINKHKLGLVIGGLAGLWHFLWSVLVLMGWAQPLLNFMFRIHFINPPYMITEFNAVSALTLIIVTSLVGYAAGWVAGFLWEWVHRS